jgi:hypothetical protein
MAVDPAIAYGPSGDRGTKQRYLRRGIQLCGIAAADAAHSYYEFDFTAAIAPPGWSSAVGGSGTHTRILSGTRGANVQYSTGATANSTTSVYTETNLLSNGATQRYHYAARFALVSAIDNATRFSLGLYGTAGGNSAVIGVAGPADATNFRMSYDGTYSGTGSPSTVDTGVAIDQAYHVAELYHQGDGILRGRIDGGAEFSATMTEAIADLAFIIDIRNGATASARSVWMDWVSCVYQRT